MYNVAMALKSSIEWTESTWNPVTGCSRISDGCKNCYAEKMAGRLKSMGNRKYRNGFQLTLHPQTLGEPLGWGKPQMIFVCSMSDLFHDNVPDDFIVKVFQTMNKAHWHTFQLLTKRAERLSRIASKVVWSKNIWMGVTIESIEYVHRTEPLRNSPALIKFLSLEPLLGEIPSLPLQGIDWVIVGGESGFRSRPVEPEWVRDLRDQCRKASVSFFFKQWGGPNKKAAGRLLDGEIWDERPQLSLAI